MRKKVTVLLAAVVLLVANDKFQLGISEDTATKLAGAVMAFLVGQGIADFGKEAEKERKVQ